MKQGTSSSSGDGAAKTAVPGLVEGQPEQEAAMAIDTRRNGDTRRPITADELPPEIKGRIKGLVYDLSNDDLPMALLDLAHLYRALRMGSERRSKFDEPIVLTEDLRTLIFSDDRAAIEEICMGPDEEGNCPRAKEGHPIDCADKWIMNKGWNFKVAPDAEACPLVSLGLAHRYLRASIAGKK
jgi:hypothetical protein